MARSILITQGFSSYHTILPSVRYRKCERKRRPPSSVMECADFILLVCLLVTCCFTLGSTQRQGLNGHCMHYSECGKIGYFCSKNRTCQCTPGYTPNKKWTKCLGYIGFKCKYDSHCIEGAYCTGSQDKEICKCREEDGLLANEDNSACITSASYPDHRPLASRLLFVTIYWIGLYLNT